MPAAADSLALDRPTASGPWASTANYQPLVIAAVAIAAGIVVERYLPPLLPLDARTARPTRLVALWWIAVSFGAAWALAARLRAARAASALLLLGVAATAAAWHCYCWDVFPSRDIGRFATLDAMPCCTRAIVAAPPVRMATSAATPLRAIPVEERLRTELQLTAIRDGRRWRPASGRCQLVVAGDVLAVEPGDEVQVFARLREPSPPLNPGGLDFSELARGDRRLAVLGTNSPMCVSVVTPGKRWQLMRWIDALRVFGEQTLQTYVGAGQAGIAAAVLLGIRRDLPQEAIEPFMVTGTVHLLVVSGLNVALLAIGFHLVATTGWLSRRLALWLTIAVVVLYTLVAGSEPPVVRAAVLATVVCLGQLLGRRGPAFNSLAAAAILVLMLNPAALFQTGPQLSFLCVGILIWLAAAGWPHDPRDSDPLDRLIDSARPWYATAMRFSARWTMSLLIASAAVWCLTLPLVLYCFHLASPIALVIAPAVWLLGLLAMGTGFVTLASGWIAPLVASATGRICGWALAGLVQLVHWAEAIPGGHLWTPGPPLWWVLGFYVGLAVVVASGRAIGSWRKPLAAFALWVLIGLGPPLARPWTGDDQVRCTFLAMGHGACVAIETPAGETLLYDAGSLGPPDFATDTIAGYLWQRGKLRIDGIVLSHADVDHYNAVPGLLERFHVGAIYVSPAMFDAYGATGPQEAPQVLRAAIAAAGVPLHEVWSGDRLRLGELTACVLHPPRERVIGSDNANSITLAIECRGRRLLLPGDLETPGLEDVLGELPLDCDIVMAPHHGSARSDPPGFAAWTTPEWVVISGGGDAAASVTAAYRRQGARVLNTATGAIECLLHRDTLAVSEFRSTVPP